jgi:hypothetical protein
MLPNVQSSLEIGLLRDYFRTYKLTDCKAKNKQNGDFLFGTHFTVVVLNLDCVRK